MTSAYIVGAQSTNFGKRAEQSYRSLTRETCLGRLQDAEMTDRQEVESGWFGNLLLFHHVSMNRRRSTVGSQDLFTPLVREGSARSAHR